MLYEDGREVRLGDTVAIEISGEWPEAVVVMLGDTLDHIDIEASSLEWYKSGGVGAQDIVVQWLKGGSPEPGAYMSTGLCCVKLKSRAEDNAGNDSAV